MEPIYSVKPVIIILIPIITAILNLLTGKKPDLRETISVIGGLLTCGCVLSLIPLILQGGTIEYTLTTILPGISVKFRIDAIGLIFAGTSSFLWIPASFYCVGYMRGLDEHAQTRFYTCYSLTIGAAVGVAFSASFFTMYLFYEIVSICTYPLVMHHQDKEGYEGSRKYLVYLMGTSKGFLLPALALVYIMTGTLDFTAQGIAGGIFPADVNHLLVTAVYVLCLFGFAKAAIMPLHSWLPSAMVAPTPVSALLHAVAVVKVGVFTICRSMLYLFGTDLLARLNLGIFTAYFVSFTIILASVIALTKDNLKARLAYSTVSQLSYIILGVALLSPDGIIGGLIHIPNHGFSKITLFFCAGAIMVATGKKNISELKGIGWRMPFTMGAFALASLSMIGVPPVCGFVSKWYLLLGSMETGSILVMVVLLASSLLNAAYFMPIIYKAFFQRPDSSAAYEPIKEASLFMVVPLCLTAFGSLVFGFYPDLFVKIVKVVTG